MNIISGIIKSKMFVKKLSKKIILFLTLISLCITNNVMCFPLYANEVEETTIELESDIYETTNDYTDDAEIESEPEADGESEAEPEADGESEVEIESDSDIETETEIEEGIETEVGEGTDDEVEEETELGTEETIIETTTSVATESEATEEILDDFSHEETSNTYEEEPEEDVVDAVSSEIPPESIDETESALMPALSMPPSILGAGSNVYWYVKNAGTELHLSGTLPTDPDYVAGHDNYSMMASVGGISDKGTITKVVIDNQIRPDSCYNWFSEFIVLNDIENINLLDTRDAIDMGSMFRQCEALTSLNLSTFDTRNVIFMNEMFYLCTNLSDLNIYNFNTENVINMDYMFYDCNALEDLDISSFDVSSLTSAGSMFASGIGYSGFRTIRVSPSFSFPTSCSTAGMFMNCIYLEGENGTVFDPSYIDGTYARIDAPGTPGYFTKKIRGGGSSDDSTTTRKRNKDKNRNLPDINKEEVLMHPTGLEVVGVEGYNEGSAKYCYFYTWDHIMGTSKLANYIYNNIDGRFYRSDMSYVTNEWVGFSYYGGRIIWYYVGPDGKFFKNFCADIKDNIYYFDNTGKMGVGWKSINNKEYYFQELVDRNEGALKY